MILILTVVRRYEVGEAVYVQSPTEGEDEFIAIITSLWRQGEDNLFHALWFCKSKDTVLGDSGSEHEVIAFLYYIRPDTYRLQLFLTDLCDNNYLEALIGKPDRLVYVKPDEPTPDFGESPDSFFFRLFYHQGKVCFTNPPYQMDCSTGDCPVCKVLSMTHIQPTLLSRLHCSIYDDRLISAGNISIQTYQFQIRSNFRRLAQGDF
jgi:hypothetical protein